MLTISGNQSFNSQWWFKKMTTSKTQVRLGWAVLSCNQSVLPCATTTLAPLSTSRELKLCMPHRISRSYLRGGIAARLQHFEMHFVGLKFLCNDSTLPNVFVSVSIPTGNGFMSNRRQAITWIDGDRVHWRPYVSSDLDVFAFYNHRNNVNIPNWIECCLHCTGHGFCRMDGGNSHVRNPH